MPRRSMTRLPEERAMTLSERQSVAVREMWALGFRPHPSGVGWVPPDDGWRLVGGRWVKNVPDGDTRRS
jgi:hypothetical protein